MQLAAVMLLVLGLFLQLTQLLTSVPLAIHGDHPLVLTHSKPYEDHTLGINFYLYLTI